MEAVASVGEDPAMELDQQAVRAHPSDVIVGKADVMQPGESNEPGL
jgi:hypothetical protein